MRALRAEVPPPRSDAPPLFWALDGGMASLVDALRAALAARGVEIRCDAPVERWSAPRRRLARVASRRPAQHDADGGGARRPGSRRRRASSGRTTTRRRGCSEGIAYASVTLVTFRVRRRTLAAPLAGTGFLVPRRSRRPRATSRGP